MIDLLEILPLLHDDTLAKAFSVLVVKTHFLTMLMMEHYLIISPYTISFVLQVITTFFLQISYLVDVVTINSKQLFPTCPKSTVN